MGDLPEIFLDILGPVAVLVAIGVVVGRRLGIPPEPLAKLAYWVIGPAFMFDALANAGLSTDALARIALASAIALVVAGAAGLVAMTGAGRERRATVLTASVYGNTGNFGLAIVIFTFDESALPYAAVALVVVNTLGLMVGVASATGGVGGVARALAAPMTLVVPPALLVNGTDATLPPILDRSIGLMADAIIPLMLLTLGIQLERMGWPRIDGDVVKALGAKLLVQPLAAIAAVNVLGLEDEAAGAIVLQAAMPAAVFTAVLAIEHDTRPKEAATIVLAGSLASMLTLPWFILFVRG
ncbi:MAG: AEC family transporter [Acidimicrobiales bacterium]